MNKKIVEISPFLKMKADQLNWTGYNAILVDEASDLGLQLEEENKELQEKLKLYDSDRTDFFQGVGKVVGIGIVIIICVFLLGLMIKGIGKADVRAHAYEDAYKDAVVKTITYVEGKYRGVSTDRIKIELLQDAYISSIRTSGSTTIWEDIPT